MPLRLAIPALLAAFILPPGSPAGAAGREREAGETPAVPREQDPVALLPPPAEVVYAGPVYRRTSRVETRRRVWAEERIYANLPQTLTFRIRLPSAVTRCEILARPAWDPHAPWERVGEWRGGPPEPLVREVTWEATEPVVLRLRVRGTRFPFGGTAACEAEYDRRTVAIRRGGPEAFDRPVVILEGIDPLDSVDYNDPSWMEEPQFASLLRRGLEEHELDPWVIDWGWGGGDLREQGREFIELAREIDARAGGRGETVAIGVSSGGLAGRFGLAEAYSRGEEHGVRTFLTVAAPHRGVSVNPELWHFLMQEHPDYEGPRASIPGPEPGSPAYKVLTSPASQQMLRQGLLHADFMAELRALGEDGYDPRVVHVGFAGSNFGNQGDGTDRIVPDEGRLVSEVRARLTLLPVWFPVFRARSQFQYDHYPGDLPAGDLQTSYREHRYLFSLLRVDARLDWPHPQTFVITHSALDFDGTLVTAHDGSLRYAAVETPFRRAYIVPGPPIRHDYVKAEWVDAETRQPPPNGENALLYEAARSFAEAGGSRRRPMSRQK